MLTLYNSAGAVTLDGSRRVAKFLGEASIGGSGSASTGTITDARFALAQPFAFAVPDDASWDHGDDASVSFSGTTLTWTFPAYSSKPITKIIYGIF